MSLEFLHEKLLNLWFKYFYRICNISLTLVLCGYIVIVYWRASFKRIHRTQGECCVNGFTSTICVCERMRLASSAQVEAVPTLYTDSVVERRRDWLLLREVVDRRRLRAPLQLFGMLNAQRLW